MTFQLEILKDLQLGSSIFVNIRLFCLHLHHSNLLLSRVVALKSHSLRLPGRLFKKEQSTTPAGFPHERPEAASAAAGRSRMSFGLWVRRNVR
jgi:hypothetical protein